VDRIAREVDDRLGAFIRGQLTVCAALAGLYTAGLLAVGIDLAVGIGLMSGALFVVPYLGTVVGVVLGCVLALLKFGLSWQILGVIAVFSVAQLIEGYILTPRIVGDKVGLHPLVVMIALIVGNSAQLPCTSNRICWPYPSASRRSARSPVRPLPSPGYCCLRSRPPCCSARAWRTRELHRQLP
jgi:hypothetical protein